MLYAVATATYEVFIRIATFRAVPVVPSSSSPCCVSRTGTPPRPLNRLASSHALHARAPSVPSMPSCSAAATTPPRPPVLLLVLPARTKQAHLRGPWIAGSFRANTKSSRSPVLRTIVSIDTRARNADVVRSPAFASDGRQGRHLRGQHRRQRRPSPGIALWSATTPFGARPDASF